MVDTLIQSEAIPCPCHFFGSRNYTRRVIRTLRCGKSSVRIRRDGLGQRDSGHFFRRCVSVACGRHMRSEWGMSASDPLHLFEHYLDAIPDSLIRLSDRADRRTAGHGCRASAGKGVRAMHDAKPLGGRVFRSITLTARRMNRYGRRVCTCFALRFRHRGVY